jgi:hypothetical protein
MFKSLTITTEELQLRSDFTKVVKIDYIAVIPFTRSLTIIAGKILATDDVFTIATGAVEGGSAKLILIGDGAHIPNFDAYDYTFGNYDKDTGVINKITFEYLDEKSCVTINNMYP